jgi:hypothetical protein
VVGASKMKKMTKKQARQNAENDFAKIKMIANDEIDAPEPMKSECKRFVTRHKDAFWYKGSGYYRMMYLVELDKYGPCVRIW